MRRVHFIHQKCNEINVDFKVLIHDNDKKILGQWQQLETTFMKE